MSSSSNAAQLASVTSGEVWVVDGSNARVGVNTEVPSTTLDVIGVCKATNFQGDGSGLTNLATTGLNHVVDDTTPQLGGNLELNNKDVTGVGNINITGNATVTGQVAGASGSFTGNISGSTATFGNVVVGGATTDLLVNGDARVTGILTIGTGSITLNPTTKTIGGVDEITVGAGVSAAVIRSTPSGIEFADTTGVTVGLANTFSNISSGVVTTLQSNHYYYADTSSGIITAYLPQSPSQGDYIVITDNTGSFGLTTCFIVANQSATGPATYIQGSLQSLEADVQYAQVTMTYTGFSTTGWTVK